jgi:hypothetical protein
MPLISLVALFKISSGFSSIVPKPQPQQASAAKNDPSLIGHQELPDDKRESHQADGAERGSGRIECGGFAATNGAWEAGAFLLLLFEFFDQRRARGEDRRKG